MTGKNWWVGLVSGQQGRADRIQLMGAKKSKILAVIGQGYVGLPLAMAAVDAGWKVIGVDNFETKVTQINSGLSPVEDVSHIKLQAAIIKGAYSATCDFSKISQASVIALCVPTPLNDSREPDLALLCNAANDIAPFVSSETLVVSESTSYPGTLRNIIIPIVNSQNMTGTKTIYFASAPERVNPGDPVWNQKNTPRLIGAINDESQEKALEFYNSICDAAISVSTPEVAEAAKLLENTFRLVNIALINELTQIYSASGINVNEVIDAASSKPYGFMPFRPGVGVGGHCIPVDPLYLTWWAKQNGGAAKFVEAADSINHEMPKYVAQRALAMVKPTVITPKVLILGVAYKAGVGDVRETPALELRNKLRTLGATVAWHDPLVSTWEGSEPVGLEWECDVAILTIKQIGVDIDFLVKRGVQILDCTNSIQSSAGITLL
jgi:UDP-N-acetyl-D-glucosamine dehydrogenase